jgi:hypothetical protein
MISRTRLLKAQLCSKITDLSNTVQDIWVGYMRWAFSIPLLRLNTDTKLELLVELSQRESAVRDEIFTYVDLICVRP